MCTTNTISVLENTLEPTREKKRRGRLELREKTLGPPHTHFSPTAAVSIEALFHESSQPGWRTPRLVYGTRGISLFAVLQHSVCENTSSQLFLLKVLHVIPAVYQITSLFGTSSSFNHLIIVRSNPHVSQNCFGRISCINFLRIVVFTLSVYCPHITTKLWGHNQSTK